MHSNVLKKLVLLYIFLIIVQFTTGLYLKQFTSNLLGVEYAMPAHKPELGMAIFFLVFVSFVIWLVKLVGLYGIYKFKRKGRQRFALAVFFPFVFGLFYMHFIFPEGLIDFVPRSEHQSSFLSDLYDSMSSVLHIIEGAILALAYFVTKRDEHV